MFLHYFKTGITLFFLEAMLYSLSIFYQNIPYTAQFFSVYMQNYFTPLKIQQKLWYGINNK